jgi:hypothetical protein
MKFDDDDDDTIAKWSNERNPNLSKGICTRKTQIGYQVNY